MQRGCRRAADSSIIYELCRQDINAASSLWASVLGLSNPACKRRHLFTGRGSGGGVGSFNGRDRPCKVKATLLRRGSCSSLDRASPPCSGCGHFLCAFPISHCFMRGLFQECKQTVLQSAGGPATRSGKATFGSPGSHKSFPTQTPP